jgi:Fur family transcriptional regulator, ferric uptake regulator
METAAKTPHVPGAQWREVALESLASAGLRSGGARTRVVEEMATQGCCRSAQEIHDALRADGDAVGMASVYRALEALEGLGLVQKTDLGNGVRMFEAVIPGGEHHHHLVCERCGKITPFEDERLERAIHDLADGRRHTATAHEVVIRGTCSRCT